MSEARESVLGRIRTALDGAGRDPDAAKTTAMARLASRSRGLVPERGKVEADARVALFSRQAEMVQATVERIDARSELPAAVAHYLRERNLGLSLRRAQDPLLDDLDYGAALIEERPGRPDPSDEVGLTVAIAGVAETGTLMLASSPEAPTTLAFLPETAIVAVPERRILGAYEDALELLAGGLLPRSINFVTGPSRTADIEQTVQLGAHGPKRLHILIIGDAGPGADDAPRA